MISLLGSIGLGLVIGWLFGRSSLLQKMKAKTWISCLLFVALALTEIQWFFSWQEALACGLAILFSLLFHHLLLKQLQKNV